jgi:hypothetical protein
VEARRAESVLEEIEDRSKVKDRMVACQVTPDDAEAIVDCCLTRKPDADAMIALPTTDVPNRNQAHPLREVDVLLGFAFGNRFVADKCDRCNGNREPGPINAKLAELVVEYYQASVALRGGLSPPQISVQWEIADRIGDRIPTRIVCPEINREKDKVRYVSTSDVVDAIGPELSRERRMVLVVAHPDHLLLAIATHGKTRFFDRTDERLVVNVSCDALALKWLARNRGSVRHLEKKTLDRILGLGARAFNLRVADPYLPYQMQGVGFTWSFFTHRDPQDCHVHGKLGFSGKTPCTECPCMKPARVQDLEPKTR